MTAPTITYGHGYMTDCDTRYNGTTGTADSGTVATTVDAVRTEGDDYWNGHIIRFTTGDNMGEERYITDFDAGTDTITHAAFVNAVAAGDEYEISEWAETEDGNTATLTVDHGDIFNINVSASAGNKVCYYSYPGEATSDAIGISTTTYTKFLARYKTSDSSIKAKIVLVFNDASEQIVLAETSNTEWTEASITTTTGKTLDHIRLYATQATGDVYYDFALVYQGIFTFPYVNDVEQLEMENNNVFLDGPTRIGQIPQINGSISPIYTLSGTMDDGSGWGTPDGQYLYEIMARINSEPWQWVTSDLINAKMTPERFLISKVAGSKSQRVWDLILRKYDLSSGGEAIWGSLEWLGL